MLALVRVTLQKQAITETLEVLTRCAAPLLDSRHVSELDIQGLHATKTEGRLVFAVYRCAVLVSDVESETAARTLAFSELETTLAQIAWPKALGVRKVEVLSTLTTSLP